MNIETTYYNTGLEELRGHIYDTPEQMEKCLNCSKPECTNCLDWDKRLGRI